MALYGYARSRPTTSTRGPSRAPPRGRMLVVLPTRASRQPASRPEWDKLLAHLQPGDVLVCHGSTDRPVGANLLDVAALLQAASRADRALTSRSTPPRRRASCLHDPGRVRRVRAGPDHRADPRRAGDRAPRGNLRRARGHPAARVPRRRGRMTGRSTRPPPTGCPRPSVRVLNGEPVEAVHAMLPEIRDAAGRLVTSKMLRAALQRPASAGLITDNGGYLPATAGGPLDETTWRRLMCAVRLRASWAVRSRRTCTRWDRCCAARKCGNQLTGELVRPRTPPGKAWVEPEPRRYYACANPHKALGVTRPCKGVSVPAADVHVLVRRRHRGCGRSLRPPGWPQHESLLARPRSRAAAPSWRPGSARPRTGSPT